MLLIYSRPNSNVIDSRTMKCQSCLITVLLLALMVELLVFSYYMSFHVTYYWNNTRAHPDKIENAIKLSKTPNCVRQESRIRMHKNNVLFKLKQSVEKVRDSSSAIDNWYNISRKPCSRSSDNLLCDFSFKINPVRGLIKDKIPKFLSVAVPEKEFDKVMMSYNSCAIISSAGSMRGSKLGKFIDSHDFVLRFNDAPTERYEEDVGSKTSMRIINSKLVQKLQQHFLNSSLFQNIVMIVWDPSKYHAEANEWLNNTEFNFIDSYIKYRKKYPNSKFYIMEPAYLWFVWDFLQCHTSMPIDLNPPSSGFLGLTMLFPFCETINVFEYIPSVRVTQKCHYYSDVVNKYCTYGAWHPLGAEKLIALQLNMASEETVFIYGHISIPGYRKVKCDTSTVDKNETWTKIRT